MRLPPYTLAAAHEKKKMEKKTHIYRAQQVSCSYFLAESRRVYTQKRRQKEKVYEHPTVPPWGETATRKTKKNKTETHMARESHIPESPNIHVKNAVSTSAIGKPYRIVPSWKRDRSTVAPKSTGDTNIPQVPHLARSRPLLREKAAEMR